MRSARAASVFPTSLPQQDKRARSGTLRLCYSSRDKRDDLSGKALGEHPEPPCLPDVEALQSAGQPRRRLRKFLDNLSYRGTAASRHLKVHGESSTVSLSYRRVMSYGGDRTVCPALGD